MKHYRSITETHTHKRNPQICNNKTCKICIYQKSGFPLTCCRLGDVHLWGLLLLGQEGRHTAKLREAAATAAIARRGQASTLQLLGLHLTDVRGVRGCGGFGTEGRCRISGRACKVKMIKRCVLTSLQKQYCRK